jgi:tetratricopeptide (TPR) repeat protein
MSDHGSEKRTLAETLNNTLTRYRTGLLIGSAVLIVGIIAAVAIAQWLNVRTERSAAAAEEIEDLWEDWQAARSDDANGTETSDGAPSSEERLEIEERLRAAITSTREDYENSYGGLRAGFVLGLLEWETGNFAEAETAFRALADAHADTYIEPIALANAAAAAEETGDTEAARELYGRVVALEDTANLERAHAVFSLGRLAEGAEEHQLALEYYNQLLDEHPDSNWTNLGRNRIIWLTSQGVGSEN